MERDGRANLCALAPTAAGDEVTIGYKYPGGVLLLRQADELSESITKALDDPRRRASCQHNGLSLVRQRLYALAAPGRQASHRLGVMRSREIPLFFHPIPLYPGTSHYISLFFRPIPSPPGVRRRWHSASDSSVTSHLALAGRGCQVSQHDCIEFDHFLLAKNRRIVGLHLIK